MQPPEPFEWSQKDACLLRCRNCGEEVQAGLCDLHLAECEADR